MKFLIRFKVFVRISVDVDDVKREEMNLKILLTLYNKLFFICVAIVPENNY